MIRVFQPTRILSAANAADLNDWVKQSLAAGAKALLIDFGNVLFMDRNGIEALLQALKAAESADRPLLLCSLGGQARMMFDMAGLESQFQLFPNRQTAEQSLASLVRV